MASCFSVNSYNRRGSEPKSAAPASTASGKQPEPLNPRVCLHTGMGDITLEIYSRQAPLTAANFLRYIREKRYQGAIFYRVVRLDNQASNPIKIAVIQGGLMNDPLKPSLPPITHETTEKTGIKHLDGVISMARGEPGSARGEFFICLGPQPELDFGGKRNPDGQGFAAFGQVVSGMDVVSRIHREPAQDQYLPNPVPISAFEILE